MLMTFRRRLRDDDAGAVAIVVALVSLVLFGIAALAIDIGEMYSRRRASQTAADLAALAGVTALPDQSTARQRAYDYLDKNLPSGGDLPPISAFSDGSLANGEILFPSTYKIRVVVPPRNVEFGFAGAIGFSNADVSAAATAEARSPAAAVPFYLTVGAQSGYSCLKDTSPGGGGGASAMREALLAAPGDRPPTITAVSPATWSTLGGDTVTVTGTNFKNPAPDVTSVQVDGVEVPFWTIVTNKTINLSSPVHPATGTATLTVTNADGTASFEITYDEPPPAPAPTVTAMSPSSGPETGGTTVTLTGTGFDTVTAVMFGTVPATDFEILSDTSIEVVAPAGTGLVNVTVTNPAGTSSATTANEYTYEVDVCAGTTGSFGYLDIPRNTQPDPSGANNLIIVNTIKGIDHSWETYPHSVPLNTECKSGVTLITDAVLDEPNDGVDGSNCLAVENGNKVSAVGEAFLDGWDEPGGDDDLDPKLEVSAGHDSVTIMGRGGMDGDHISKYLTVPLATFVAKLADPTPAESEVNGWIKGDILDCPRFAIVPVLNVDENPPNGYYPIVGFAGVFVDGPAPDYGFSTDSVTGTQVKSIRAYAFSLNYLPGIVSSGTTAGTVTFLGSGPKVPVLVHDSGDPSY